MTARRVIAALVMQAVALAGSEAQPARRGDTLHLAELHDAAANSDPRQRQLALQRQATALRLRSITSDRLPSVSGEG